MFNRLSALFFAGFLFRGTSHAQADPNVSGSYYYDVATKLYTYSYQPPPLGHRTEVGDSFRPAEADLEWKTKLWTAAIFLLRRADRC